MENGGTVGLGDAMILSQGANGGWGNGAGCFMWIILLFALMGGVGGWNNRDSNVARIQDVYASNDNQTLNANVRDLSDKMFRLGNGISDATFALQNTATNGFANLGRDVANGTYVIDKAITDNRYVLGQAINENRFAAKDCCCTTNRNIDQLRFDNQMGMNNIQAVIHAENEETRKLIVANQMEQLKFALAERDRIIMMKDNALSQQAQTCTLRNDIINAVRPFPQPSFLVGNPYGANSCNCGCGVYNN